MIKIIKIQEPEILVRHKARWTEQVVRATNNKAARRYVTSIFTRHSEIKEAIVAEAFKKCVYCEIKMRGAHRGEIDHIVPLSVNRELAFEWTNLVLACTFCNGNKGSTVSPLLINPTVDDPPDHLAFDGHYIRPRFGSLKGEFTRNELDLNRTDLIEKRQERLDSIIQTCLKISKETEQDLRNSGLKCLRREVERHQEYCLMTTQFMDRLWTELTRQSVP
ncbi:MAG: hypothetical protein EKK48_29995 [Candidatus Melainabacteria bacterium]|nr:MAG: hypothetical protein EKK48_29995 [Candidatus Melainabacteria bacterium]